MMGAARLSPYDNRGRNLQGGAGIPLLCNSICKVNPVSRSILPSKQSYDRSRRAALNAKSKALSSREIQPESVDDGRNKRIRNKRTLLHHCIVPPPYRQKETHLPEGTVTQPSPPPSQPSPPLPQTRHKRSTSNHCPQSVI
jgi:hypothetical protein